MEITIRSFPNVSIKSSRIFSCSLSLSCIAIVPITARDEKSNISFQEKKDFQTLNSKLIAANLFTDEVSSSISWINLYQPKSLDPWEIGTALKIGVRFLSQYDFEKTASLENVYEALNSMSSKPIEVLKEPVIILEDVSLKIPIYCHENRTLTKYLKKICISKLFGDVWANIGVFDLCEIFSV